MRKFIKTQLPQMIALVLTLILPLKGGSQTIEDRGVFDQVNEFITQNNVLNQERDSVREFLNNLPEEDLRETSEYKLAKEQVDKGVDPLTTRIGVEYLVAALHEQFPIAKFQLVEAKKVSWLSQTYFYVYSEGWDLMVFPTYKKFILQIKEDGDGWGRLKDAPSVFIGTPTGFVEVVQKRSSTEIRDYHLKELLLPVMPELLRRNDYLTGCKEALTPRVH